MIDLEHYQASARRYIHSLGLPVELREDIVQEICLEVLEKPDTICSLQYLVQHALDRLDPRTSQRPQEARRYRKSERLRGPSLTSPVAWDTERTMADVIPAPEAPAGDTLARAWLERQLAQLDARTALVLRAYFWGEQTLYTIGAALGVSEARISQMITAALLDLGTRYYAGALDELPSWDLRLEVVWQTLP